MWEYLSTYSKSVDANVNLFFFIFVLISFVKNEQAASGGSKLYYRADFADYMVSLSERNAAVGFVCNSIIIFLNLFEC